MNSPLLETLFNFSALHPGMTFFRTSSCMLWTFVVQRMLWKLFDPGLPLILLLRTTAATRKRLWSIGLLLGSTESSPWCVSGGDANWWPSSDVWGWFYIWFFIWFHMMDSKIQPHLLRSSRVWEHSRHFYINSPAGSRLAQGIGQILYQKAWSPSGLAVGWRSFPSFMPSSRYWAEFSWNLSCQLIFMGMKSLHLVVHKSHTRLVGPLKTVVAAYWYGLPCWWDHYAQARMPETERWIEVLRQRKMFTLPSEVLQLVKWEEMGGGLVRNDNTSSTPLRWIIYPLRWVALRSPIIRIKAVMLWLAVERCRLGKGLTRHFKHSIFAFKTEGKGRCIDNSSTNKMRCFCRARCQSPGWKKQLKAFWTRPGSKKSKGGLHHGGVYKLLIVVKYKWKLEMQLY